MKKLILLWFVPVLVGLAVAVIFGGCASSRTGKALNVGVVASGVLDLHSTQYALDRGGREANVLVGQHPFRQAVVKGLGISTVMGLTALLEMRGSHVWAHIGRGLAISAWSIVAARNYRVGQ